MRLSVRDATLDGHVFRVLVVSRGREDDLLPFLGGTPFVTCQVIPRVECVKDRVPNRKYQLQFKDVHRLISNCDHVANLQAYHQVRCLHQGAA